MLELLYDNKDAVPEVFQAEGIFEKLFTADSDGKLTLTGVTGMKTQKDVNNVTEALRKEREDHSKTKSSLKPWGELKPEETLAKLDRIKELELAAEGKLDDDKINEMVESRLLQKTGPLERQITEFTTQVETLKSENDTLKGSIESRDRNDSIRSIAIENKAHPTAVPDIEMSASVMLEKNDDGKWVTKSGVEGLTPGLDIKNWMKEMTKIRPHWWPESEGGGARGAKFGGFSGDNPFSADHWNLTEQGKVIQEQGRDIADRMAKSAGTIVGGGKPQKK